MNLYRSTLEEVNTEKLMENSGQMMHIIELEIC